MVADVHVIDLLSMIIDLSSAWLVSEEYGMWMYRSTQNPPLFCGNVVGALCVQTKGICRMVLLLEGIAAEEEGLISTCWEYFRLRQILVE